jgi:valyl-tRNA synthetase
MSSDLEKPYDPKKVENRIYEMWEKSGYFDPDKLPITRYSLRTPRYSIVLPPPNITGSLHMGHALNAIIQDILIRKKRMEGYRALWAPGTDHAGIATQNAVEKELKREGLTRHDLGRKEFLNRVWQWKEKYGNTILEQLKKIGASCDWSRTRFTMDNDYQKEVENAFLHYYKRGWIYRAERVINWCSRCQTSLSDLELEYRKEKGKLWFIRYPIVQNSKFETNFRPRRIRLWRTKFKIQNSKFIVVATTRPETMLGDSAVAVHPSDLRYKNFIGQNVILPLTDRKILIISDRRVESEFGTGAVKVTPAHSVVDSEIGQKHNLPFYKIIDENGKMLALAGEKYNGFSAAECRQKVVEDLEKQELIEKIEDYEHNVAHCYRCGNVIENLPSMQWFLKMSKLAEMAIKAVKSGKIKFHPKRWEKFYFDWLKNVKDWCISRQIWWGHRLPVFFCRKKLEEFKMKEDYFIVSNKKPEKCPICKQCEMQQIEDVLDTWFSSALWPFAVFRKKSDCKKFYPTNTLVTARDIINLWVARMAFSGLELTGKTPFKDVIIHATILTSQGKRMSKSLGTGLDPMDFIEKYGSDAARFALIWQSMGSQDIHWSEEALVAGRKFLNKIWNASRFVLAQSGNFQFSIFNFQKPPKPKTDADKEILKRTKEVIKKTNKNIDNFEFGKALRELYDFFWRDFCDVYIEASKLQKNSDVLLFVLAVSLRLLHPFLPHITEEIWSKIPIKGKKMLIIEKWPLA